MIRPATHADIAFLLDIARQRYKEAFDVVAVREFLARAIGDPSMLVLRGDRGGAVVAITRPIWGGPSAGYLLFLAALPGRGLLGEGVALVRAADAWRRERGAERLHFGEGTGLDFEPLARRLGARTERPSYVLEGGAAPIAASAPVGAALGSTLLDRVLSYPNLIGGNSPIRLVEKA